uniref:Ankyrin repeat domain-containing protein 50 n=1 Tax=Talaromyces marneffei PM1 TaxID=1077442 RepID=A0A093VM92_TALMA
MAQSLPQLDNSDYTIGWIAALPHERSAAQSMLDEKHAPPLKHPNDENIYTLGSIYCSGGKHNVVIASLPPGRSGPTPAATTATHMLSSFPEIKFGLIVGIGGGIPSDDNDIRLGDVVVSQPDGQFGGVRQYDRGKATFHGFEECGALNSPPRALLNAVGALQSKHEMEGSVIPDILEIMCTNYPLMAKPRVGPGYVYQGAANDRLFNASYKHTSSRKECSECDNAEEKRRPERPDQDPYIFYGTIASGNAVIKDAHIRDLFPINDRWQRYAAATAAAYAKELLSITDVTDVRSTPDARRISSQLQEINSTTQKIASTLQQTQLSKERQDIYQWLSPLNISARHSENQKTRVDGTGLWLLEHVEFGNWLSQTVKFQTLCCYGDPGAGKTILSSLVIDHLEHLARESKSGLSYIYCDYKDPEQQSTENIVGAIIKQLLIQIPQIPDSVVSRCRDRMNAGKPLSLGDASELFSIICAQFSRVYICLDALDELQESNLRRILKWIQDGPSVHIFLTSRPHIQDVVLEYLESQHTVIVRANESDIRRFIEHEIGGPNDIAPRAMDERLKGDIFAKILGSAKGIFLLPSLQVRTVLQAVTKRSREESLESLPSSLGEAFAGTITRILQQPNSMSELARKIIPWVHFAERPLTVDELASSLAIHDDDNSFNSRGMPDPDILLHCCYGLVVVDQETSTIRLVHYSLAEYLSKQEEIFGSNQQQWHDRIATVCLRFLNFSTASHTEVVPLKYAATQWGHHLRRSDQRPGIAFEMAKRYLDIDCQNHINYSAGLKLLCDFMYKTRFRREQTPGTRYPLVHIAAFFGLDKIILQSSWTRSDLNSKDVAGRTPIAWAAESGFQDTTMALIKKGATALDWVDDFDLSPLILAAIGGHRAVGQTLIGKGAKPRFDSSLQRTTSIWAAEKNGNNDMLGMLAERSAASGSIESLGTLMRDTVQRGNKNMAEMLIEKGAAINSVDGSGRSALITAVYRGNEAMVEMLIEKGAALDVVDDAGRTPLVWAIRTGKDSIVKMLVEKGATVNSANMVGKTALMEAVENGSDNITRILTERHDLAIDAADTWRKTALMLAAETGKDTIARILAEKGATLDLVNSIGQTALMVAADNGKNSVVEALIEKGAAINFMNDFGETALTYAELMGYSSVIETLKANGAKIVEA